MTSTVVSIVFAGLGGQGVITVSDILAEAAFADGYDVKKSDIHGMAQRGGSVKSDVRFGQQVHSPMIPLGEADYLVVMESSQIGYAARFKRSAGVLISPGAVAPNELEDKRSLNVALLGILAHYLAISTDALECALLTRLRPEFHANSLKLFRRMGTRTRALS